MTDETLIATGIIAPLIVAGLVQGLSLLREHDREIIYLVAGRGHGMSHRLVTAEGS